MIPPIIFLLVFKYLLVWERAYFSVPHFCGLLRSSCSEAVRKQAHQLVIYIGGRLKTLRDLENWRRGKEAKESKGTVK